MLWLLILDFVAVFVVEDRHYVDVVPSRDGNVKTVRANL